MTLNNVSIVVVVLCLSWAGHASTMVWGVGYRVSIQEPAGWATTADVNQNDDILIGLYQKGFKWENSPAVIYARLVMQHSSARKAISKYISELEKDCPSLEVIKLSLHEKKLVCGSGAKTYSRLIRYQDAQKLRVMWILSARDSNDLAANTPVFDQVIQAAILEKGLVPWNKSSYLMQ